MQNSKLIKISNLGLNEINIDKANDSIYLIDFDINITVKEGIFVNIIDNSKNSNISIVGLRDSNIKYTILNSSSSKRVFNISGELNINEINLEATNEELTVNLLNENASCNIRCLSIATNMNNIFKQLISHKAVSTFSNITNVGVAMDKSNITFDTSGKIEKGMNKSKCAQLSKGIVMDDTSIIEAKPILLIDEFDCFANHGASIGKMSDDDLFYLMSRGLTKSEAFLLILQGIIKPFIDNIDVEEYKSNIESEIKNLIEK